MKFIELLRKIEERSGLYLGGTTFMGLKSLIDGYVAGATGKLYGNNCFLDTEFQKYIQDSLYFSDYSWYRIINACGCDDHYAFDRFFKYFNKFLEKSDNLSKNGNWTKKIEGRIDMEEVFESIRNNPYDLLIEKNIECIRHYTDGIFYSIDWHLDEENIINAFDFIAFSYFVASKYNDTPMRGWVGIIRLNSKNEEDAFRLFFELYDEFKKRQKVTNNKQL